MPLWNRDVGVSSDARQRPSITKRSHITGERGTEAIKHERLQWPLLLRFDGLLIPVKAILAAPILSPNLFGLCSYFAFRINCTAPQ